MEFAVTIPLLLSVALATVDAHHLLHAYSSLQAGVRTALRCVYPTDGKCTATELAPPQAQYEYFAQGTTESYLVNMHDYNVTARWLRLPVREFFSPQARILDEVIYDLPQRNFEARKLYVAPLGRAPHATKIADLPYVAGDPLDPLFYWDEHDRAPRAAFALFSSQHHNLDIRGQTRFPSSDHNDGISLGSVSFQIPSPLPTKASGERVKKCFEAARKNKSSGPYDPLLEKTCAAFLPDAPRMHFLLHVEGIGEALEAGAQGAVSMQLTQPGRAPLFLGGRLFDGQGSGNFYPRGLASDRAAASILDAPAYQDERNAYGSTSVWIRPDIPARLEFRLHSRNGRRVAWRATRIRVFSELFTSQSQEVPCEPQAKKFWESLVPHVHTSHCQPRDPAIFSAQDIDGIIRADIAPELTQTAMLGCFASQPTLTPLLVTDPENFELYEGSDDTCPWQQNMRTACPPDNFGVSEAADHQGFVINSSAAAAICPASGARNVRWSEKDITLPAFDWTQRDCRVVSPTPAELPPHLRQFAKLVLGPNRIAHHVDYFTGAKAPAELKQEPQYECAEVQEASTVYDERHPRVLSDSLLHGARPELCDTENRLREAAIKAGMNPDSFMQIERVLISRSMLNNPPDGTCSIFQTSETAHGKEYSLGIFPGNEVPSQCAAPGIHCRAELRSLEQSPERGEAKLDFMLARSFGQREITAAYPRAHEDPSLAFGTALDLRETDDNKIEGRGSIQVPLRLLFNSVVTVQYSESRLRETAHAP